MLPSCMKTESWKRICDALYAKINAPIVCGQAVFGKLSFFQEVRNRTSDVPFSNAAGIRYVHVPINGCTVCVGPFKVDESHVLDEELSDARESLPLWQEWYAEFIEFTLRGGEVQGKAELLLSESLGRAKLLLEFSQSMTNVPNSERALQSAMQFLVSKFKLGNMLLSAQGKHARYFDVSEEGKQVEERIVAQVKATRTMCAIHNVATDFLLEGIENREKLPKCMIGLPLLYDRELAGYAIVSSDVMPKTDYIVEVLYELVSTLQRISSFEKAQVSAATDPLTGIGNRAELSAKFEAMHEKARVNGLPMSVIMVDVDNFKNFNDTKGHVEGDRVLRVIAEVMRAATPKGAISGRYGGEEFMMVLAESQEVARSVAEKIRVDTQAACELTVSVGVVTCLNGSASKETLVREADRALYRAKEVGKNKVIGFLIVDKNLGVIDA